MTLNWTSKNVWKQERTILQATSVDGTLSISTLGLTYTPDAANKVLIDLTEYTRTLAIGASATLTLTDDSDTKTATITIAGLVDPSKMLLPYCEAVELLKQKNCPLPHIVLPSVIIAGSELAELNLGAATADISVTGGTYAAKQITITSTREVSLSVGSAFIQRIHLKPMECGKTYCDVKWQGASGIFKQFRFLLADHTITAGDGYELLTDTINYAQHQGREEGATLRLEGLTPYDMLYYSDLASASEVSVRMIGGEWESVRITGKGITIPNSGNKLSKLEIKFDWRSYDVL